MQSHLILDFSPLHFEFVTTCGFPPARAVMALTARLAPKRK